MSTSAVSVGNPQITSVAIVTSGTLEHKHHKLQLNTSVTQMQHSNDQPSIISVHYLVTDNDGAVSMNIMSC